MNLRWLPFISSSLLTAAALSVGTGCTPSSVVGGSSSSSSNACAGDGGLVPTPVGPQAITHYEKFALPPELTALSTVASKTPLVALLDEKCVLSRPADRGDLTQALRPDIEKQGTPIRQRAYQLKIPHAVKTKELKALAEADPCLISLTEDAEVFRFETVNDPGYSQQAHLPAIDVPLGWDTFYAGLSGNVIIAIIDDGMQMNHPDLAGALWVNTGEIAGNSIDDDGNGYVDDVNGYNFSTLIGSPAHENGASHGTHVAGLAAAIGNNSVGVTGVIGSNARIMVLNVFGANAGASSAAIANAINYASDMGAHVINMSLGGSGTSAAVNTAMINAAANGVFIAIAAGNSNQEITSSAFVQPAGYAKDIDGAMAVGSTDALTGMRSSFSNYSTTYVEIGAPGSDSTTGGLYSTYPTSTYTFLQGTSMASPVLAGSAALLIEWVQSQGGTITPAEVETLLKNSADANGDLSPYFLGGFALNVANLAESAQCSF